MKMKNTIEDYIKEQRKKFVSVGILIKKKKKNDN